MSTEDGWGGRQLHIEDCLRGIPAEQRKKTGVPDYRRIADDEYTITNFWTDKLLELITEKTLVVGIDIARHVQWARTVDYRGIEIGKAIRFTNDKQGLEAVD